MNYYRKDKSAVYITMPLRDRNGDAVAAVRFVMKKMPVQTEENALVRAMPMLKQMQAPTVKVCINTDKRRPANGQARI